MAQFVNMFEVDLRKPTGPQPLRQMVAEGDAKGNRVGAIVTDDGAAVALGGSCVGKVVRADGATVPLTGTISGNTAYVVLDQASCAVEGPIQVAVCWVSGTDVTTLLVAYGTVVHTQTGNAVQPSTPIPDLTQLLAEIDDMREATAAAEAAIEGALLNYGILQTGSDLDDIKSYTLYGLSSLRTYDHCPVTSGMLYTMQYGQSSDDTDIWLQLIYAFDGGVYKRYYIDGWSDWVEGTRNNYGVLPDNSNLNNVKETCVWGIGSLRTYINCPIESGMLYTTRFGLEGVDRAIWSQVIMSFDGPVYQRYCIDDTWSTWQQIDGLRALNVYEPLSVAMPGVDDLDDVKETGIWGISSQSTYANCPLPSSGWLECYKFRSNLEIYIQRVWSLDDAASFARYYTSGSWSDWTSRDGHDIKNAYYAFGDSTTYGQIGGGSGQSKYNYPACIGRLLKMFVHNYGTGGQGLLKDWDGIHTYFINGLDMSDAALITVGWAYNDGPYYSGINFGAYDDTGSDTFIGKYFTIMREFQQKCPSAYIILITGYGYPDGAVGPPVVKPTLAYQFTHEYTFADGPRTVMEMYDTLEAMCHLHGWGCINQANGTCFNQWNASELIGDQVHPTDDGNLIYGNMIAARVSALWANLYKW